MSLHQPGATEFQGIEKFWIKDDAKILIKESIKYTKKWANETIFIKEQIYNER